MLLFKLFYSEFAIAEIRYSSGDDHWTGFYYRTL